jgi:uncharacterized protein (TIGR02117 family)
MKSLQSKCYLREATIGHVTFASIIMCLAPSLLAGCILASTGDSRSSASGEPTVTAWVLDHGWHTAIVARRSDVDRALWPEVDDFPGAVLVEVAWGDREFYMAPTASSGLAVKAALWAGGSVLHVVGFSTPIAAYFSQSHVVELRLSRRGFDAMTRFIHDEYQRDHESQPVRLERGLYGTSWFYAARSRYYLFNTCNTWVARALSTAGLAVTSAGVITAGGVMRQIQPIAASR